MKPWVHPQDRRSRIYYLAQIIAGTLAGIAIPVMLLQDPTRDHIIISIAAVVICIVGVFLLVRAYRKLPEEFRTESDSAPNQEL